MAQATTYQPTGHPAEKGDTMSSLITASVSASGADDALARVERYLVDGFATTGAVSVKSKRHMLWNVEVKDLGGDRNDCWVMLSSYGISAELGSVWEKAGLA